MANSAFAVINTGQGLPGNNAGAGVLAGQDPEFSFVFALGTDQATGTLDTIDEGNGSFLATSGTLTVTSSSDGGVDVGTYSLVPGSGGAEIASPTGAFLYDDLIFPGQTPGVDNGGLLFSGNNQNSQSTEINIYSTGTALDFVSGFSPGNYDVVDQGTGTLTFAATPEPSAVALFATVLLGLGIFCRRSFARS
jgi:hypothetical protein